MSSPQITYLFGAGASALRLPVLKQLPERIQRVKEYIEKKYLFDGNEILKIRGFEIPKNPAKVKLMDGLQRLYDYSSQHSTVDTYAKKLYIKGSSELFQDLKFYLAVYFNIEQKISGVDPRYDTFLISLLDSELYSLPNNLKFLSWNYDLQMELAYEKIIQRGNLDLSFSTFNSIISRAGEGFCSCKLNGSCSLKDENSRIYPLSNNILVPHTKKDDLDLMLGYGYFNLFESATIYERSVNISFAWSQDQQKLNKISEIYSSTEILIVIGYSFPFFNREIDRHIIQKMINLKKIYIQDLFPLNIKSRFLSILPDYETAGIEIIPVDDLSEFFLPPEL